LARQYYRYFVIIPLFLGGISSASVGFSPAVVEVASPQVLKTMKINEKIRTLRELKNLTQENMAQALDISPTAYGNLERGETPLTYDKLEQIATVL
jgi:DNA-binding XRE family transcriptional regulator